MEYYSALKRKEILTHTRMWMNLEDVMLSEISQSQCDKYCVILLLRGTYRSQTHRDRKYNGGCQELGGGENGQLLFNKPFIVLEFQLYEMRRAMGMPGGDGCTAM